MGLPFFDAAPERMNGLVRPGMLCAFDFDGTIAPIVRDPDKVWVPTAVSKRLATIRQYARLAVITGRSVEDVRNHIDFLPDYVVGNHGLEGIPGKPALRESCKSLCEEWERQITQALNNREFDPQIRIENKGLSLSVHFRLTADKAKAERQLSQLLRGLSPEPHVIEGKCVFNLLPKSDINKGNALIELMNHCQAGSAIYVGDDVTDEDVFNLEMRNLISVRIGRNEASRAQFFIYHRLDMVHLLDELIRRFERGERQWA
jgi:trehalose 6-phosphate phosphatase